MTTRTCDFCGGVETERRWLSKLRVLTVGGANGRDICERCDIRLQVVCDQKAWEKPA